MASKKLRGKDLRKIGYPEKKVIGIALNIIESKYKKRSKEFKLDVLADVLASPKDYLLDDLLGRIAQELVKPEKPEIVGLTPFKKYKTYGDEGIEVSAKQQMNTAMQLPVTVAGALMPDAHHGYGLPIGGVLATNNAVIPYGVGVDIGCRMCMTMYDMPETYLERNRQNLKKMLQDHTKFGREAFKRPKDHSVLSRNEFEEIPIVKSLKDKAWQQIGSSGGGNHFVEFGIVELLDPQNEFDLPVGKYLGVLSHSGSRGLGATIAKHYTDLARKTTKLPRTAQHLAWLDLNTEAGQEYWLAMNLAGDYASACHHQIHQRLSKALGEKPLAMVENHHNFAWKEQMADGTEVIVHRKGATPAGKGVLGVIPGTMTAEGFIVRGKGNEASINSASHGAGRVMSRSQAKSSLTNHYVKNYLADHGVELLGGGLDEAPMAYKNIHQVMAAQEDLVDVLGTFLPKVVRMCGE